MADWDDQWPARVLELLALIAATLQQPTQPGAVPPPPVPDVPGTPPTGPAPVGGTAGRPGDRLPTWTLAVSTYPTMVQRLEETEAQTATGLLVEAFRPPAPGQLTVAGVPVTGTAWLLSVNDEHTWAPVTGTPAGVGGWTEATVTVVPGDQVQVGSPVAGLIPALRVVYRPT